MLPPTVSAAPVSAFTALGFTSTMGALMEWLPVVALRVAVPRPLSRVMMSPAPPVTL